ncbi:hypothetical protein [Priestia flexa]|uniref:hypothetical protein n=1 Tax=Priestia flexa TaxID=86664 RepID=UPI0024935934|nr:hypothetical protein [Priestia flexa]
MNNDYTLAATLLAQLDDSQIWNPITINPSVEKKFDDLVKEVQDSKNWPQERNHEKGKLLEKLVGLILNQFQVATIDSDFTIQDNQIDHEIIFHDQYNANFIKQVGSVAVCECKNEKSKVDVSYMAKLIELCECRNARFGIFVSLKGLTGKGWIHAEGKRKKNFLRKGIGIIHFTFDELKTLKQNNFYTLMKHKFKLLVDEVDEEFDDIYDAGQHTKEEKLSFDNRIKHNIKELLRLELITNDDYTNICKKVDSIYKT